MHLITGYGVDIADEMIKAASLKYPSFTFETAGCESIPFADGSMDVITVCAAYHHFPNVDLFAKEAERLLKPNGLLYIADVRLPAVLRVICNPFMPLLGSGDVKIYSPWQIADTFTKRAFVSAGNRIQGHIQLVTLKRI
jgi:ubiquinone/menaquinone biosynthesis C-methylase UbiE